MIDPEALAEITRHLVDADRELSAVVDAHPDLPVSYVARARFRFESASSPAAALVADAVAEISGVRFAAGAISDYARVAALTEALAGEHDLGLFCEAQLNTGALFMRTGAFASAREVATRAIDKLRSTGDGDPLARRALGAAHQLRGTAFHFEGRVDEALSEYDRALAAGAESAELRSNRGEALVTLERFEEATADYERALALDDDNAEAKAALAQLAARAVR